MVVPNAAGHREHFMTFSEWVMEMLRIRSATVFQIPLCAGVITISIIRMQRHRLVSVLASLSALGFLGLHLLGFFHSYVTMTAALPSDWLRIFHYATANLAGYLNLVFVTMLWSAMFIGRRPASTSPPARDEARPRQP